MIFGWSQVQCGGSTFFKKWWREWKWKKTGYGQSPRIPRPGRVCLALCIVLLIFIFISVLFLKEPGGEPVRETSGKGKGFKFRDIFEWNALPIALIGFLVFFLFKCDQFSYKLCERDSFDPSRQFLFTGLFRINFNIAAADRWLQFNHHRLAELVLPRLLF